MNQYWLIEIVNHSGNNYLRAIHETYYQKYVTAVRTHFAGFKVELNIVFYKVTLQFKIKPYLHYWQL